MTSRTARALGVAGEALGRLAGLVSLGIRRESRRRRALWVAIAVLLVLGPIGFNLARGDEFRASLEVFSRPVPPYAQINDAGYWRALLRDPELHHQTALNIGTEIPDYRRVKIVLEPGGRALRVTVTLDSPGHARTFVNALGPQLAGASSRQLYRRWQLDARAIRDALRGRVRARERAALKRRLAAITKLGRVPPTRAVVGPRAGSPHLDSWADRFVDAMPGGFVERSSPLAAGLAGLLVALVLWLLALVVVPPPGAVAALVAQPEPTPPWLRAIGRWFKPERPPSPPGAPPHTRLPRGALIGVAAMIVLAGLVVFWAGRGEIFLSDDWAFVLGRRGGGADTFLQPHNQHLVVVLAAIYKALFATVGMGEYWPYRMVAVVAHVACLAGVFVYARSRVGWIAAAALAAPILFFGPAFDILLFPFDITFPASLAAGIAALLALERKDRRGDIAACGLLVASLVTWELGACFALGAAIELLLQRDRRRLWIPVAPLVVYGAWYVAYAADQESQGPLRPFSAPAYAFRLAANAIDSLLALPLGVETQSHGYHRPLELLGYLLVVAAIVFTVRRVLHIGRLTPRVGALLAITGSYWLLTGAARAYAGDWYASRYVYTGSVLVLLTVAELARGVRIRRRVGLALAGVAVLAAAGNLGWLLKDSSGRRADTEVLKAELGAVELVRAHVPPTLAVDDKRAAFMTARAYLEARDELGSPAMAAADLPGASLLARQGTDALLQHAVVRLAPAAAGGGARPGSPVAITGSAMQFAKRRTRCVAVNTPPGRTVAATFVLPRIGVVVIPRGTRVDRRPVEIRVRRFASTFLEPHFVLGRSGDGRLLRAAPDRSPHPWRVEVSSTRRFSLC